MYDPYLYEDIPVLKNKLGIRNEKTLDHIEAEQSRANMMLLYEQGFQDFSPNGLREIHRFLFGDIYEWAGQYRIINIEKREKLLAGRSVWYSNDDSIQEDLDAAFRRMQGIRWDGISRERFIYQIARFFPSIWQVHPFREGNTRTVVMMMTFFVENYGYYMDQELLAASAGYVRDSFVMTSLDQFSEFEHLERILLDAVCSDPVEYDEMSLENPTSMSKKYQKYQKEPYVPEPHYHCEK
ncbi:Fic family protein [Anaerotruncus colihominis]|uniref:Fic/DOC family protein n=1 Tax=Anaerotruncus colihominis TaxID=169435 RepID=UPI0026EE5B6B|nr:Fic family protein [Anaerotruncus colihominis]